MKTKPKLANFVKMLGLGLREPNQLTEDLSLQTPLEQALYEKNHKSFELLYGVCTDPETVTNPDFVYVVIMRNLFVILDQEELHPTIERFF